MSDDPALDALLGAKTIAVVGLDSRTFRPAYEVAAYLQSQGYRIIPVPVQQPADEVLGERAYASLQDIPEHVDLVDVFVRPEPDRTLRGGCHRDRGRGRVAAARNQERGGHRAGTRGGAGRDAGSLHEGRAPARTGTRPPVGAKASGPYGRRARRMPGRTQREPRMTATNTFAPPPGLEETSLRLIPHVLRPLPPLAQEMFEAFMVAFGGRAVHIHGYTFLGGRDGAARRGAGPAAVERRSGGVGAARVAARPRDLRGAVVGGLRALADRGAGAGASGVRGGGGAGVRVHDAAAHGHRRPGKRADGVLRREARGDGRPRPPGGGARTGGSTTSRRREG